MAEVTYSDVTWTAGDIITEAKLDSMIANDRAVDSMYNGVEFTERAAPSTPAANKIHVYAKDKGGIATLYMIDDSGVDAQVSERHSGFTFTYAGDLTAAASVTQALIATRTMTIIGWYAKVLTAPTGQNAIFDINKNGTSLWSATPDDRPHIHDGETYHTGTAFFTTSLVEGDILTLDIDQAGSTVVGADATIVLKCK